MLLFKFNLYPPDLKQLRAHITREFRDQFETGLVHYLTGDWGYARDELEKANEMMRDKVGACVGGWVGRCTPTPITHVLSH